jgi:DNA-binding response OmpR family regulator
MTVSQMERNQAVSHGDLCCPHCGEPLGLRGPIADKSGRVIADPDGALIVDGRRVWLTSAEASYCRALLLAFDRTVTNEHLYDCVYGLRLGDYLPDPQIVKVTICHLRRKLAGTALEIKKVRGIGYLMRLRDAP